MHDTTRPGPAHSERWWDEARAFDAAVRDGRLAIVFLVGMARSGTTWLTEMLSRHPAVAQVEETHLFNDYLRSFPDYLEHLVGSTRTGITRFLPHAEIGEALRPLLFRTLVAAVPAWRERKVIVDKTPDQENYAAFILSVVPEARFLHIRRDPRAAIGSWRAGSRTWARNWGQYRSIELARKWLTSQEALGQVLALTPSCESTAYEKLHDDAPAEIERLLAWLGVAVSGAQCEAFVRACDLESMRERRRAQPEPTGKWRLPRELRDTILRRGTVGGWERDLSRAEIARIEHVAGDVMARLGYARTMPRRRWLPSVLLYKASLVLEHQAGRVVRKMRR